MVALIVRDQLFVANAGDSRAVLCRGGKAVPMSGAQGGAGGQGSWIEAPGCCVFLCLQLVVGAHVRCAGRGGRAGQLDLRG